MFNTDQGSQFTSLEFTSVLKDAGIAISMDVRGRCMDNILILPSPAPPRPRPTNEDSTGRPGLTPRPPLCPFHHNKLT